MLNFLTCVGGCCWVGGSAMGLPQCGQADALSDIDFPHSGQLIKAMI